MGMMASLGQLRYRLDSTNTNFIICLVPDIFVQIGTQAPRRARDPAADGPGTGYSSFQRFLVQMGTQAPRRAMDPDVEVRASDTMPVSVTFKLCRCGAATHVRPLCCAMYW